MTTIAVLRRPTDNLAQRWLRTGGDHARTDASHHRTQPATATLNDNLHQQAELLLLSARRVINRLQRLCASTLSLSASLNSP